MLGRDHRRIDILTGISGVSFREAWAGRVEADFVRKPLYVIGRDALLKNKRASARAKDLRDVAALTEHTPPEATKPRKRASGPPRPKKT
jgi:hypothetical protein